MPSSEADIDVISAIIKKYASVEFSSGGHVGAGDKYRPSPGSCLKAAEALIAAGYRKGSSSTADRERDEKIRALDVRIARVEGYMVLPAIEGLSA